MFISLQWFEFLYTTCECIFYVHLSIKKNENRSKIYRLKCDIENMFSYFLGQNLCRGYSKMVTIERFFLALIWFN